MIDLPPALIFVAGALLVAVLPARLQPLAMLATPVVAFLQVLALDPGTTVETVFYGYEITPVRVDELSLPFAYIFVLASFLAGVYGARIMQTGERVAALLYAAAALGVVFAGDLLSLFVAWEVKAVASAFLIWAGRARRSSGAGMRYLFAHVAGGTILLAGILAHVSQTGSLEFTAFEMDAGTGLILVGFLLAAAVPPLHAWLADGYPESTIAGTVFLSAFTTKAAVYVLARGFPGQEILVWLGVAMALYGVVYAVLENDIRRLLGYHIVSQVGYMVAAVGLGGPDGVNGATAHAFAHILYKGLLLMGAGAVIYATGRRKLTELGGFARTMPIVVTLYMVGAFSISGVPLFSGFVSKELVTHAFGLEGRDAVVQLLKLASVGTFLHTGLKLPYFTWFGPKRDVRPSPVPPTMLLGMGLTAGINIVLGVYPRLLYDILPFPVDYVPYTLPKLAEITQLLAFTALGFVLLLGKLGGEPTVTLDTDWLYRGLPRRLSQVALPRPRAPEGWEPATVRSRIATVVKRLPEPSTALLPTWVLGSVILVTFAVVLGLSLTP